MDAWLGVSLLAEYIFFLVKKRCLMFKSLVTLKVGSMNINGIDENT